MASVVSGSHDGRISIQPSSLEISIRDDDLKPRIQVRFARSSYVVPESGGQVALVVMSDGVNQESISIPYVFTNGTAQEGLDASLEPSPMVLPPGATSGIITLNIIDDSISEARETFAVQLLPVSGVQLIQDTTEITINDNDAVHVTFERSSYSTFEGGEVVLPIQKRGSVDVPISVSFSVTGGTALAMIDFMPPTIRTVTFSPSEQMQQVTVDILPDDITEGTGEFFLVELTPTSNPVQVTVDQSLATVTIMETAVLLSAPPLTCDAIGADSTNCTWTKPDRETVVSYLLTWNYIGPCSPDTQSFLLQGSDRRFLLTNLQEGGDYEVSVTAVNIQEQGPPARVPISTQSAIPVGSPQFLRTTAVTSSSITLEWDEIVCLDQNGLIIEYHVDYGIDGSLISSIDTSNRGVMLTGLLSDESYTVRVAGSNSIGRGPFTQPLVVLTPIAEINECLTGAHNCDVNADCIDTRATFICRCRSGYVGNGTTCTEIQGCLQGPCDVNAVCINGPRGRFNCLCQTGFSGDGFLCTDIDECSTGSPCGIIGSTCTNRVGSFGCACNDGFSGNGFNCTDIDECTQGTHNCSTLADCDNGVGGFSCQCRPGYVGDGVSCSNVDECAEGTDNCHRFATCLDSVGSFECTCRPGFLGNGVNCEDVDECEENSHNCHASATCTNTIGGFNCECLSGYRGDGVVCEDIDECAENLDNCHGFATCLDNFGSFECQCGPGYSGNGTFCEDIDECVTNIHNCHSSATCRNTIGQFECDCQSGYRGDGITCEDIDECEENSHNCHASATCTNTIGGFNCNCLSGFRGDGVVCEDIDECSLNTHNCHSSATCRNTIGQFECECQSGYRGDGITCEDINECEENSHNCHASATCNNTIGGFKCDCLSGYRGDGVVCDDIDECSTGQHDCDSVPQCVNTPGGFRCLCFPGYESDDGRMCRDIDECERNTSDCHASALCSNTDGGFICVCSPGFVGNGTYCEVSQPTLRMGFNVKALTLSENQTIEICVARTSNQTRGERIAITVQSRDDTAVALQDYRPILETLKFNNESSLCVEIFAIPDLEAAESNEYFTLWLSSNDSVQLDPRVVNITITNLAVDFIIGFTQPEYVASSSDISLRAIVNVQGRLRAALLVDVATSGGNATVPEDYFTLNQQYFFVPGLQEHFFDVSLGSGTERTQNVTFCMTITSTNVANNEIFGIYQRKATGIIIPSSSMSGK